jgi:hypothetical protein
MKDFPDKTAERGIDQIQAVNFVETSTYHGEAVKWARGRFDRVISIEVLHKLATDAQKRFSRDKHIEIYRGSSPDVLKKILPTLEGPTLFWLAAHWNGRGDPPAVECPLLDELRAIEGFTEPHIILIDDYRLFLHLPQHLTSGKWPTVLEIGVRISAMASSKGGYRTQCIPEEDLIIATWEETHGPYDK